MTRKASKARTLAALLPRVSLFRIPEFIHLPVAEFERDAEALLDRIAADFAGRSLVIRSSASDEDGSVHSQAGAYDSVLDVPADDRPRLRQAIATVAASYGRDRLPMADDEIIVQAFLQDTAMSGVVFTHDLNTGAPYYVINYDDISGLTNTVTSGGGEYANRTLYIHRGATAALRSSRFQRLIAAVQELEALMGSQFLDIEFALDQALHPYLLQVRAITTQPNWNRGVARRIDAELGGIQAFVRQRLRPMAGVFGATTVLGQMPDWNPAEMIGRAPRALSLSLYRRLVTDNAWRLARQEMGYAVPAGQPLMVSLAGQPFIDTRLSFHSYLPATLPEPLAVKLVDAWVARLRAQPELHDKIEFEVAITTFSFDIDARLEALAGVALDAGERAQFRSALRELTWPLLRRSGAGSIAAALARIETLAARRLDTSAGNIAELFALADDCLRYGTVPFAMLARHGFIARTLLLSLCARGVFTAAEVAALQAGVRTVAGELVGDMRALQQGRLSRQDFMCRYGHLRPGTYDILSPRYDQMEDFGVGPAAVAGGATESPAFRLTPAQRHGIEALLAAEGWAELSPEQLLDYIAAAIAGREYGKFVFTRSVSAILELVAAFGEHHGLSREEMSHVPLDCLLEVALCSADSSIEERLRGVAAREAERHALTVAIRLPQVLFDEAGVHVVPFQVSQPNFITARKLTAEVVHLDARSTPPALTGRIVLIENADPGYDWIFAQRIGGLVTKYGGANSHMAIRCAEFGIPAAIGCGEQRFEAFVQASRLSLDCAAGLITPLH